MTRRELLRALPLILLPGCRERRRHHSCLDCRHLRIVTTPGLTWITGQAYHTYCAVNEDYGRHWPEGGTHLLWLGNRICRRWTGQEET